MPADLHPASPSLARTVWWASLLTVVEAAALLVTSGALLVLTALHTSTRLWAAFTVAGFALLGAAILALCARGLRNSVPSARTPVALVQLLALPVCYSLGFQAGKYLVALPIMCLALAILVLLFTPSANMELDRNR